MPTFNTSFSINARTTRQKITDKYVIVESKCKGLIYVDDKGVYRIKYKGVVYSLTNESYETKGKRVIYARWLDCYGHRIKIIRDRDSRIATNIKLYCGVAPGLLARGKLVKSVFGPVLFHVIACYNESDTEGMIMAFRTWKEYEDKVNNKQIDIKNELE